MNGHKDDEPEKYLNLLQLGKKIWHPVRLQGLRITDNPNRKGGLVDTVNRILNGDHNILSFDNRQELTDQD